MLESYEYSQDSSGESREQKHHSPHRKHFGTRHKHRHAGLSIPPDTHNKIFLHYVLLEEFLEKDPKEINDGKTLPNVEQTPK